MGITSKEYQELDDAYKFDMNEALTEYHGIAKLLEIYNRIDQSKSEDKIFLSMSAEHDIVYLIGEELLPHMTLEDANYLIRCGIHWTDEHCCLYTFT